MNRKNTRTHSVDLGKLPPQAVEMEEAVLGAILLESHNLNLVDFLKPEMFYKEQNGRIFDAISRLYKKRKDIDILTVTMDLKATEELELVGGAYYISQLTNRVASSANLETHARFVQEKYLLREVIRICIHSSSLAYEDSTDCFDLITDIQKQFSELTNFVTNKIGRVGDIFLELTQEINSVLDHNMPTGVMSGLTNVDKHTGGWQKGDLIVGAARPGMGKTAFVLICSKNAAIEFRVPVLIFSLEMQAKRLVGRLASSESDIDNSKIYRKSLSRLELQTLGARSHRLLDAPIFIDDTPAIKFTELRNKARKMVQAHGIGLIIIDYLQLMGGEDGDNREQEISYNSRNLKALAKELDIPILALSQLSRQVENRAGGNKRPQLSDLRESGAIEQDADMVMFFFRPEVYEGLYDNGYPYGHGDKQRVLQRENLMIVDWAKGREIDLGEVPLKFYGKYMKILNYDLPQDTEVEATLQAAPLKENTDFLNLDRNDIEDFSNA